MSLLTKSVISEELAQGRIKISPDLEEGQIREASIDLRLGNVFRVFDKSTEIIPLLEETNYQDYTREIVTEELLLLPQETVLAITMEKISLPNDICGWLEGRSRFARLGLLIHISAGLIQPGIENHQVLEITNLSPNVLKLQAGQRVCQLAFLRCEGQAQYKGRFQDQVAP